MSKNGWYIIGGACLLMILIFFSFFTLENEPDVNWYQRNNFADEQAYGYTSFISLLEAKYDDQEIMLGGSIDQALKYGQAGDLLIIINPWVSLNLDTLDRYLSEGQKVLVITNKIVSGEVDYFQGLVIPETKSIEDSCLTYTILDKEENTKEGKYCYYFKDMDQPKKTTLNHYPITYLSDSWESITEDSYYSTGVKHKEYEYFMCHVEPLMFSNIGVYQDDFLMYFNALFRDLNPRKIRLTTSNYMAGNEVDHDEAAQEHPLEYIMSQPALKSAYYTLILGVLLYITVGSRRKQRPIKVQNPIKNTSLEYIKAVSDVYLSQGQNEKLIKRQENIFYHFAKTKYFVDKKDTKFIEKLEHKSKVPANHISKILNHFNNIEKGFEFNDRQLFDINGYLNYFYRNCK